MSDVLLRMHAMALDRECENCGKPGAEDRGGYLECDRCAALPDPHYVLDAAADERDWYDD